MRERERERERERSLERTSRTEKEGGIEDETEREVCHKANRESEAIFALFFAKPKKRARIRPTNCSNFIYRVVSNLIGLDSRPLFRDIPRLRARSYSYYTQFSSLWSLSLKVNQFHGKLSYLTSNRYSRGSVRSRVV